MLAVFATAWSDAGAWSSLGSAEGWSAWVVMVGSGALVALWLRTGGGSARSGLRGAVLAVAPRQLSFLLALGSILLLHRAELAVSWPWYVPIGCAFALGCGYLWADRDPLTPDPELRP